MITDQKIYDEVTVGSVLEALGIEIKSTTYNDFLTSCSIHGGSNDPSMTVSKELGVYICHNPSCDSRGTLLDLVMHVKQCNAFVALRFINKYKSSNEEMFTKTLQKALTVKEFPQFSTATIDKMHADLWNTPKALEYLRRRGFEDNTISYFKLGYSVKQGLIVTPMHDSNGNPVGVVGRTIEGKRFQNSKSLPVRETLFNLHRAKRTGGSVVIVESNFDALSVWQAGHQSVVASLGGNLSEQKIAQLDRNFESIIIAFDDDDFIYNKSCRKCIDAGNKTCIGHKPGLDLGRKLEKALPTKSIYWAHTGGSRRLFAKDMNGMTKEQIQTVLQNKISRFEARGVV